MSNQPMAAPDKRYSLFGYEFATYTFGPGKNKWEAVKNGRGVSGYRTPIHAFFALRRWMKQAAVPMDREW